jgi:hypothetical protein
VATGHSLNQGDAMTLADLLKTVEASATSDWHKLHIQTVYGWETGHNWSVPNTFSELFIYKPDIDISLALVATEKQHYVDPWVTKFPDPYATAVAVALRYRGAVVYEWAGVTVDGGCYLLPMPDLKAGGGYEVPKGTMTVAELLFQLYGPRGVHQSAGDALKRAGVPIV